MTKYFTRHTGRDYDGYPEEFIEIYDSKEELFEYLKNWSKLKDVEVFEAKVFELPVDIIAENEGYNKGVKFRAIELAYDRNQQNEIARKKHNYALYLQLKKEFEGK